MRRPLLALVLLAVATPLTAHDFWIDLPDYRQADGIAFPVRLLIGDIGEAEPWDTYWRKIVSLRSYGPDGVTDHLAGIFETTPAGEGGASVTLTGPGTHVLAFESYQSESDLPADEFNAYAEHEGLAAVLAWREANGQRGANGREFYSRRAKALVQVGGAPTDNVTKPVGQTLEIVPETNPYALAAGDPLTVRVLFRGRPLEGASVVMERIDEAVHGTPVITDAQGRATFRFDRTGNWRVGVVWSAPIDHPRFEFDTVFASMTFGFAAPVR